MDAPVGLGFAVPLNERIFVLDFEGERPDPTDTSVAISTLDIWSLNTANFQWERYASVVQNDFASYAAGSAYEMLELELGGDRPPASNKCQAMAGIGTDLFLLSGCDTVGGSNGEQICEGHGYDEATCNSIGCCQYDTGNGNCWSDVGDGPCTGYEPPTFETYVRSTGPWAKLNPSRPTPDARAAFAFAIVGTGIFVHGGANPGPQYSLEMIQGVCA